jgi:uncharacterized protein (DUF1330 family)
MKHFVIADIFVTDPSWVPTYAASVHHIVHKHGGRYLSRSGNVTTLEGTSPETSLIAIMEFPSPAAVEAFISDAAYAPFAAARRLGSESRFRMIDATDVAGTVDYLDQA